ncbi:MULTISPECIES: hypothetical protein [unclassified Streptomyces]|uniref:hypothetical protein n=1 Tax=unclassified Streptomyces TaxID=2593676 RepID=UPI00214B2FF6|nr:MULTISPECIES: hypothetical protein [unclassified Streptomyces]
MVDCRPLDRIDARSAAKCAAARAACEAVGWGYRVVGEVEPVRMVNVRWLAGYRNVPTLREKLRSHAFSNDALFRWTDSLGRSLMLVTTPDDYDALQDESH